MSKPRNGTRESIVNALSNFYIDGPIPMKMQVPVGGKEQGNLRLSPSVACTLQERGYIHIFGGLARITIKGEEFYAQWYPVIYPTAEER